jgi:hypothetical protein
MRRKKIRGVAGIALMALAVAAMYVWLTYGKETFSAKQVLVAGTDIEEGTVIEPEKHFAVANIDSDNLINGVITKDSADSLKGLAAKQFIPKNAQITDKYFAKENLVVSGDKVVFKIPGTWIYALPQSIRRGDDINIYEIDSNIEKNLNIELKPEDGNTFPDSASIKLGSDKPVLSTAVLYVKDSTNREVVDADERKRFDGTSQVSSVEIICTKEEIALLERKVADG